MVGVENRTLNDDTARSTRVSSNEVPQSDPSRRQLLPVNAWRVPTQLRACEEYCRRQGYEVLERFHGEGESAKSTDQASFKTCSRSVA